MSSAPSSTLPPSLPSNVKGIAWLTLVGSIVAPLVTIVLVHTVRDGEVLFTDTITAHQFVAMGWTSRLVALLAISGECALWALAAVYTLKGRMWGYCIILASLLMSALSRLVHPLPGHGYYGINFGGILWLIVFLLGFKGFREFARYQTHTRHPDRA